MIYKWYEKSQEELLNEAEIIIEKNGYMYLLAKEGNEREKTLYKAEAFGIKGYVVIGFGKFNKTEEVIKKIKLSKLCSRDIKKMAETFLYSCYLNPTEARISLLVDFWLEKYKDQNITAEEFLRTNKTIDYNLKGKKISYYLNKFYDYGKKRIN